MPKTPEKTPEEKPVKVGERIARRIARAGVCSRRDAEKLIVAGKVTVNGKPIDSPALNVVPNDTITVDGKPLAKAEPTRLWLYNKPKGRITSSRDPEGRPTIYDDLPDSMPRVITVGRLDYNTEGLLLLTNDGALARKLELPSTEWKRLYRVRVYGRPNEAALANLANGITVDGIRYGAIIATIESARNANSWLNITLTEGKNRETRKVMEHMGLEVTRLIRVSYGPFQLGRLPLAIAMEIAEKDMAEKLGLPKKEEPKKTGKKLGKKQDQRPHRNPYRGKNPRNPEEKATQKPKGKPGANHRRPS